jgi:hypothetical protein
MRELKMDFFFGSGLNTAHIGAGRLKEPPGLSRAVF